VTLPALPSHEAGASAGELEATVIASLDGAPARQFIDGVTERYGGGAGSLAELAIRSNLLLLTYSPRRDDIAAQAARFSSSAEGSGLPRDLWGTLADLLDSGGEYVEVRSAVFQLHQAA